MLKKDGSGWRRMENECKNGMRGQGWTAMEKDGPQWRKMDHGREASSMRVSKRT